MTDRLIRGLSRDRIIRSDARGRVIRGGRGSAGASAAQDLMLAFEGAFGGGQRLMNGRFTHAASFTQVLWWTDSTAGADVALTVQVNGSTVATITIAAGQNAGQQSIGIVLGVGDRLSLIAPSPADAQLADLSITFGSA